MNCLWSKAIDCHCCFINFELNSAQRKINFETVILFPLEFHLLWRYSLASCFVISENPYMSLFERFPFWAPTRFPEAVWAPTRFPEAVCPRYGPDYLVVCITSRFPWVRLCPNIMTIQWPNSVRGRDTKPKNQTCWNTWVWKYKKRRRKILQSPRKKKNNMSHKSNIQTRRIYLQNNRKYFC